MGDLIFLKLRGFVADYPARHAPPPDGFAEVHAIRRGARHTIGRTSAASIVLPHETVSRVHAAIDASALPARLSDQGSTSGTRLNGRLLRQATTITPGDEIGIGQVLLLVHEIAPRAEPRSADDWAHDLASRERDRRWAAAEALGSLGESGRGALAALLAALDDEYAPVRRHAARALGLIGHDKAVAALCKHLDEPDELVAVEIVRAIGRFEARGAAAAEALAEMLADKTSSRSGRAVQEAARQALWRIGPAAVPVLKPLLECDDSEVVCLAAQALADLAAAAESAVPLLAQMARHVDPEVRRDVLRALSKIGSGAAVASATLFDVLERDEDARVRAWAASALGTAARDTRWEGRAVAELTRALEDHEVRFSAIVALGRLGPAAKVAIPSLQRIAHTDRALYAHAASEALASIAPSLKQSG